MSSDEGSTGRRPKRRCSRISRFASSNVPSAIHYVGYVEDDETPEMIMAKFAELQRIQEEANQRKQQSISMQDTKDALVSDAAPNTEWQLDQRDSAVPSSLLLPSSEESRSEKIANKEEDIINALKTSSDTPLAEEPLSEDILLQVFKQTSMFNVRTALQDNAMLMGIDGVLDYAQGRYGSEDPVSGDEDFLRSFWSDDEDYAFDSETASEDEGGQRRARRQRSGGHRGTRPSRVKHRMVTAYNPATQALVRRRVRAADPDEILQIRIPGPPIPLSWGRPVKPYATPRQHLDHPPQDTGRATGSGDHGLLSEKNDARDHEGASDYASDSAPMEDGVSELQPPSPGSLRSFDVRVSSMERLDRSALPEKSYVAALVNPSWEREGGHGEDAVAALARLNLPKLVPEGFVFVWTPKQHISSICKLMSKWGYVYVENLTWVYLGSNNKVLRLPSRFARSSHLTLYMFRMSDKGKWIELRHQRNPDVLFDCLARSMECLQPTRGADVAVGRHGDVTTPDQTFETIETLLPTAKGRLLELWAPGGVKRPGWTHVIEV